jgi:hypothetical protein
MMSEETIQSHPNDDNRELLDRGPLGDKEPTPFTPLMRWRYFDHQTWMHKTLRQPEYPEVKDQLDMLWHAMNADESKRLEPFYSTIKEIKDKYPKAI